MSLAYRRDASPSGRKEGRLFPLFLELAGRPVVVVGAGPVGTDKALRLVEAGAAVTVIAPAASAEIAAAAAAGALRWLERPFAPADLDEAWLAVAATGLPEVNAAVARAGAARRVFVNAVDDPARASAYAAAVLRRGPVTVAISSGGRAPALCRLLREALEELLPTSAETGEWLALAERLRSGWRRAGTPMADRRRLLLDALQGTAP